MDWRLRITLDVDVAAWVEAIPLTLMLTGNFFSPSSLTHSSVTRDASDPSSRKALPTMIEDDPIILTCAVLRRVYEHSIDAE